MNRMMGAILFSVVMLVGLIYLPYIRFMISHTVYQDYVFIGDEDFIMDLGFSRWKDTIWNEEGGAYSEIENKIADLFYNETDGDSWGASILFQGEYPNGIKYRKILGGVSEDKAKEVDYVSFSSKYPIPKGKYWLEAKWRLVDREFNVKPSFDDAKGNMGIEFIGQIGDYPYSKKAVRIAFVFCGFAWNGSDFEETPKGSHFIEKKGLYDNDVHITFFIDELKNLNEWQTTRIDLGSYINQVFELLEDEGITELKIRLIQIYVEGIGVSIHGQYDYVRAWVRD